MRFLYVGVCLYFGENKGNVFPLYKVILLGGADGEWIKEMCFL